MRKRETHLWQIEPCRDRHRTTGKLKNHEVTEKKWKVGGGVFSKVG